MQLLFVYTLKFIRKTKNVILKPFDKIFTSFILYSSGVKFNSFQSKGIPKINVSLGGKCEIGNLFKMNNRESANPIGRFNACSIFIGPKGNLTIGNNVGMSSSAIVCNNSIEIGNNVNLGGNVVIYDTDFHSLDPIKRKLRELDISDTKTSPVKIGNSVFIGAHSTILKGVEIGNNSIIGAGSVVTKKVPENEVWAGNPAKFIRKIN
jgi:acetyltransferase-like isoleucine patch superfamily enzyme